MMRRGLVLLFLALLLFARSHPVRAAEEGSDFKPTTTHIEADAWHVLKIERPEPDRPREMPAPAPVPAPAGPGNPAKPAKPAENKVSALNVNLLGLFVLNQYRDPRQRVRAQHSGILEAPFFSFDVNQEGAIQWHRDYVNWYWFAFYDGVVEKNYEQKKPFGGDATYLRVAFLDAPIAFTGYRRKYEAPQRVYWEAFDLPFSTTISHLSDKDKETWKILNVPLVEGFRYDRKGGEASTSILDVPLATLYSGHSSANGAADWKLLDIPFATLAKGGHSPGKDGKGGSGSLTILDVPLACLYRQESNETRTRIKVLDLPILGPLLGYRADSKGVFAGPLPELFASNWGN
jgi:hypothetical protein